MENNIFKLKNNGFSFENKVTVGLNVVFPLGFDPKSLLTKLNL